MDMRHSALVVMLVGLASLIGCATTDELEAAKTTMRASLTATKQSLESRIRQLEDTKKKFDDQQAHLAKAIKSQEETSARVAELENMTMRELTELRTAWQREKGALAHMLDAEEAAHREGLLAIQRARNGLSPLDSGLEDGGMTGMPRREAPVER